MMDPELLARFAASPVARLGTIRPDGAPHVVPIVFTLAGDVVYTAVDAKPKRTQRLQRLANLRHEPRCTVLVDHYDEDWSALWWVRADGVATVLDQPEPEHPGLLALAHRYPQYRTGPPTGPLVVIAVHRWTGWQASA